MGARWEKFKVNILKEAWEYVSSLWSEWDDQYQEYNPSKGYISFWIVLYVCVKYYWILGNDTPPLLWKTFVALLCYAAFKISKNIIEKILIGKLGNGSVDTPPAAPDAPKPDGQ